MKIIFTTIFLLCGIFLQAQDINSLIRAGEQAYHQKHYPKARNAFYKAYTLDKTNPRCVSNLLLTYYKIKNFQNAYEIGHTFLKNTPSIPLQYRANIYHNLALNCEALDYPADALYYYQKANKLKQHPIRINKIEQLTPIVEELNTILSKIEKELPQFTPLLAEAKQIRIPSGHPISDSLHDYILRKIEDYHDTFQIRPQPDSTLYFHPIRIRPLSNIPLYILTCKVQFWWNKNDYNANIFVDNQGHIIDIPIVNRYIEDMLIEDDGDYLLNTCYHLGSRGQPIIYTLYHYNKINTQAVRLIDVPKRYYINQAICPTFYSNIYIKDNLYRIRYGKFNSRKGKIDVELGDQWLYKKGNINKIPLPEIYAEPFKRLDEKYGKGCQTLEHVKFY